MTVDEEGSKGDGPEGGEEETSEKSDSKTTTPGECFHLPSKHPFTQAICVQLCVVRQGVANKSCTFTLQVCRMNSCMQNASLQHFIATRQ